MGWDFCCFRSPTDRMSVWYDFYVQVQYLEIVGTLHYYYTRPFLLLPQRLFNTFFILWIRSIYIRYLKQENKHRWSFHSTIQDQNCTFHIRWVFCLFCIKCIFCNSCIFCQSIFKERSYLLELNWGTE